MGAHSAIWSFAVTVFALRDLARSTISRAALTRLAPSLIFGLCAAGPLAATGASELVGHTAVYEVTLESARAGSGVVGAEGRLVVEFDNLCDGYVLTERMLVEMRVEGGDWVADYFYSAHEAADSGAYRFITRTSAGGRLVEDSAGKVIATSDGGRALAYTAERPDAPLATAALLPVQMARALIAAAEGGASTYEAQVVDAVAEGGAYDIFAAIRPLTEGERRWRVDLSFFQPGAQDAAPNYETSFVIYPDGRSDDVLMRYENFSLRAKITEIDLRPVDCG